MSEGARHTKRKALQRLNIKKKKVLDPHLHSFGEKKRKKKEIIYLLSWGKFSCKSAGLLFESSQ